jgi:hypothetical protein
MHTAIRQYQVDPGSVDEITRGVNEGLLPLIKMCRGSRLTTRWTPGAAGSPR